MSDGLREVLKAARRQKLFKAGARPVIQLVQRRYRNMRLFAHDGLEFDLRALAPAYVPTNQPRLSAQAGWARACFEIVQKCKGNLQFQFGIDFPYRDCPLLKQRRALELFKSGFVAGHRFLQTLGIGRGT